LAQQYPPSAGDLAVSTAEAGPGDEVTVAGDGYAPNSDVTITFESVPVTLAVVRADAAGRFTTRVRIPADATPGTHTLRATGVDPQGRPRVLAATINIRGGPAGTTNSPGGAGAQAGRSGTLSRTGASSTVPASIAAVTLIAVGSLLLLHVRREPQPTGLH